MQSKQLASPVEEYRSDSRISRRSNEPENIKVSRKHSVLAHLSYSAKRQRIYFY